jgi:AraC-like DNA-binding protein
VAGNRMGSAFAIRQYGQLSLAQRALRDADIRVRSLALELGYSSESAFSNAFKREVGESPLRYRRRVRDEASQAT